MMELDPRNAEHIRIAFERGTLRLEIDKPRAAHTAGYYPFDGDEAFPVDVEIRVVHLISVPQRGEIRGYVLIDNPDRTSPYPFQLRFRTPIPSEWAELDAIVARKLDATPGGEARKHMNARVAELLALEAADTAGEPFCACGRVISQCDGSRKGCGK